MARLGDICKVCASSSRIDDETCWLLNLDMVEQQTGAILAYQVVHKDNLKGSIVQFSVEHVLYSKLRPNLNKVVLPDRAGYATSEMLPLLPDKKLVTREYLAYFLRSNGFVQWAVSKTAGAKMPRLGTKELLKKEIPLPSLDEQKKIATKFRTLEKLIAKRKQQLEKLDELLKARFVEMFGEPAGRCSYPKEPIGAIGKTLTGSTPSMKNNAYYDSQDIPFFKPSDISESGVTLLYTAKNYISENARKVARVFPVKAVLVTCIGTIGKVGIATVEGSCNQQINVIIPESRVTSGYLAHCILYMRATLAGGANAPVVPIINKSDFSKIEIPMAPIKEQRKFSEFTHKTNKTKSTIQKSLNELQKLFDSLMQEYFG